MTDREALLSSWVGPSSASEQDQQERAERMVKKAITGWPSFAGVDLEIYTKGSYPNNTNVKSDSDVDVVVECRECTYDHYETGVTGNPAHSTPYQGEWEPPKWRSEVRAALVEAFGSAAVDATGKVAINVAAVPGSRPSADVVPSFLYYRYRDANRVRPPHQGSCVFDTSDKQIINWPQQQLDNGRNKNTLTGGRYKKFVRALKRIENALAERGDIEELPSYFMECLVWNVRDATLSCGTSLSAGFEATLVELWKGLDTGAASEWEEPNGLKWLFPDGAKWSIDDGRKLMLETWSYLDY